MTEHEISSPEGSAETASFLSAQSVPDASTTAEQVVSDEKEHGSGLKPKDAPESPNKNGKDTNPETPKGRTARRGKREDNANDKNKKEKEKESPVEGKAKKPAPYVNEDRVMTGGSPREKLSPEELTARMERIRLNNEKIKERRAAVQADEQAFQESQAASRAREARQRKIQATIDEKRAAVAKRKMERAGVREWDSFKKGGDANVAEGDGTYASIHAPRSPDASSEWPYVDAAFNNGEAKEGHSGRDQGSWGISESDRGGRGRGRGAGRGRERGRGSARGRGARGGGATNDSRRERAPHVKDKPEDIVADTSGGDWGTAADEWGRDPFDIDTSQQVQETGIAITTNEADPWGSPGADDPWVPAPADDPSSASSPAAAETEVQKS
ncbi:hypothetical protein ACEPAI_5274 [Sanghuangporus weigelae]